MNVDAPSELDINRNIIINFDEPIESIDTSAIHMQTMIDSVWQDTPFIFQADTIAPRRYVILANWQPGQEYQLTIDSLGFKGIYGLYTDKTENKLKVKTIDQYGTLYLNITGAGPQNRLVTFISSNPELNIIFVCSTIRTITANGTREIMKKNAKQKKCSIFPKHGK